MRKSAAAVCAFALLCAGAAAAHTHVPFAVGDVVDVQCRGASGLWEPAPVCDETGEPLGAYFVACGAARGARGRAGLAGPE